MQVHNAAVRGAVGAILLADPAEVVGQTTHLERDVWPEQWWLPGWAVQRGTGIIWVNNNIRGQNPTKVLWNLHLTHAHYYTLLL